MNITFTLPSCMSTGVCSNCGGCGRSDGSSPYVSEYDPAKAGNAAKLIWETGGAATFFTNGKLQMSAVVTYYIVPKSESLDFNSSAAERQWASDWGFTGRVSDLTAVQKNAIRATAEHISATTGLTLIEVQDPSQADLRWRGAEFSHVPGVNPGIMPSFDSSIKNAGTIFFNSYYRNYSDTVGYSPGERGFSDMLHEWGHLIGLKHGFFGNYTLTKTQDTRQTTVMSHIEAANGQFNKALTSLDLEALRYIYGSAASRDAKGVSFSQMGYDGLISRADNAGRTVIGLDGGTDRIIGGSGNDTIFGMSGSDIVEGNGGSNVLHGGSGTDTAIWNNIFLNDITSGRIKLTIWNQDARKTTWSGEIVKEDGSKDYFSNFEIIKFADVDINLNDRNPISNRFALEKLYKIAFRETNSGTTFDYHLNRLNSGSMTVESLAREFLESRWFIKPAGWDQLDVGGKIEFLWQKMYPRSQAPEALKGWANATNDFYGAVQAIVSVDSSTNPAVFNKTLSMLGLSVASTSLSGAFDVRPRSEIVINEAYEMLLGRAATKSEVEAAAHRRDWEGVSFTKIIREIAESDAFRQMIATRGPTDDLKALLVGLNINPLTASPSTISSLVVKKIWGLPDNEDLFSLLERNGSYGFTIASAFDLSDTVLSYHYKNSIKDFNILSGNFIITNEAGVQVSAPSTVKQVKMFDGIFYVGHFGREEYVKAITSLLSNNVNGTTIDQILAEMNPGAQSVDSWGAALFEAPTFKYLFNSLFPWVPAHAQVQSVFRVMLDRDPTPVERVTWDKYINIGGSILDLGRSIAASQEMIKRYSNSDGKLFVTDQYQAVSVKLYEVLLSRRDDWAAEHIKKGYDIGHIIELIIESTEYNDLRLRGKLSNEDFSKLLVHGFFGEDLDNSISSWTQWLNMGNSRKEMIGHIANRFMAEIKTEFNFFKEDIIFNHANYNNGAVRFERVTIEALDMKDIFANMRSADLRIVDAGDGFLHFSGPGFAPFVTNRVNSISTIDDTIHVGSNIDNLFRSTVSGDTTMMLGSTYAGPVSHVERQFIGDRGGQVVFGTKGSDFIKMTGGANAVNGGVGDDVLDGGVGSNFLTGGIGNDIFFLDGRGGGVTWSTITDWEPGEQLSLWGWRPGISKATWVDFDGAEGYQGLTLHAQLNGNGVVDASVTWSGRARHELPAPLELSGLLWFIG